MQIYDSLHANVHLLTEFNAKDISGRDTEEKNSGDPTAARYGVWFDILSSDVAGYRVVCGSAGTLIAFALLIRNLLIIFAI